MPQLMVIDRYHAAIELNSRRTVPHPNPTNHSTPISQYEVTHE